MSPANPGSACGPLKLSTEPGTLSMANTGRPFSPGQSKHPVFGKVIEGMDVVHATEKTKTDANDRPLEPVQMKKISIVSA